MQLIKDIPDNSIDLIVTDPPYKITARGNGKIQKGLVKRRQLEANWFFGNKLNFA